MAALAGFYRDQHALIADAIIAAQAQHAEGRHAQQAELAGAQHDLAQAGAAIDRYLTAFENGTLDPEDLAGRLAVLKARIADRITGVMKSGTNSQCQALIEALTATIKITGPGTIIPVFRVPQPAAEIAAPPCQPVLRCRAQQQPTRFVQ